jgi:hypothetical protein
VRGNAPLPPGFKPRQTTIQCYDKVGGKLSDCASSNVT